MRRGIGLPSGHRRAIAPVTSTMSPARKSNAAIGDLKLSIANPISSRGAKRNTSQRHSLWLASIQAKEP